MTIRFEYVRRQGERRRILKEKRCEYCHAPFTVTTRDPRRKYCSKACAAHFQRPPSRISICLGYEGYTCNRVVRRKSRCDSCRGKHAAHVAIEFDHQQRCGPKQCALPVHGGICQEITLFQVNREGLTVMWCPTHGERLMPVLRPGSKDYPTQATNGTNHRLHARVIGVRERD